MAGWRAQPAADDGTKYGTMIHREYYTLIRVLRPMAQLYFYYSAMNAGKSTALLQSSYNYQERGMRTVVYTAEIDDRFGAGKVSSRIGLSSPAEHASKPVHCVLVDESQFLTREQVHALSEVVDELDIPVLCYGLRTDFRGELFAGSQYLLAWSDKLVELKTICFCGRKASMVLRLDQSGKPYADGEQVVIGGNERYVSVCRKHYKEALAVGSLTALQGDNRK